MANRGPKRKRSEEDMRKQQLAASKRYYERNAELIRQKQREKYHANKNKNKVKHLIEKIAKLQKQLDNLMLEEENNEQK